MGRRVDVTTATRWRSVPRPTRGYRRPSGESAVGGPAESAAGPRLAFPTPEQLEALAVPTDESFGPYDGQGASPIKPATEPHQRQTRWTVDPSRPDFAFLIETELFAQEEILGGQGSFGP